jgi:subtilisin
MKNRLFWMALLLLLISACDKDDDKDDDPIDDCLSVRSSSTGQPVDGRYIISIPSEEDDNSGRKNLKAISLLHKYRLNEDRIVNHFTGELSHYVLKISKEEAARLKSDPSIIHIEQDRIVSVCGCISVIEPRLLTWNVEQTGYADGTGKTAWLMDTGIDYFHPDLKVDTLRGRSFIPDVPRALDDNGHGTHVAGIIGAKNNRIGTLGVASGATVVPIKVLDVDGNGLLSYVIDAITYLKTQVKAGEVINISLGVEEMSDILDTEIKGLAKKGVFITIAAGNESENANKYSPGRTNGDNIYTVSAVDSLGNFADFSNFGNDAVDYAAPGVRVLSTYKSGKYAYISGTSMAAPHVAGILLVNNGKVFKNGTAINDPDGTPDPLAHQ